MSAASLATHIALGLAAVLFTLWVVRFRSGVRLWAAFLFLVVIAGLAVERRSDLAWDAMALGLPSLVFLINQTFMASLAFATLLIQSAADRSAKRRAVVLGGLLVCASLWSCAWIYAPLPEDLTGTVDKSGYCQQTTDASCAAAAAAMLAHAFGIPATERGMAVLCLTREHSGTMPLGLYHGMAVIGERYHLRPQVSRGNSARTLPTPCIIEVGLRSNAPKAVATRMAGYGWTPGLRHAVFISAADPAGKWIDVADPSYGRERWPTAGLDYIWDGHALTLVRF